MNVIVWIGLAVLVAIIIVAGAWFVLARSGEEASE